MRTLAFLLSTALLSPLWAESRSQIIAEARRALASGQFEKAERLFEGMVHADSTDMEAWQGYTMAYEKRRAQEDGGDEEGPRDRVRRRRMEEPDAPDHPEPDEGNGRRPPRGRRRPASEAADGPVIPPRRSQPQVDKALVRNPRRAKQRFEELRDERSSSYRRQHSGVVAIVATFYDLELYRAMSAYLAAKKGYDAKRAQRIFEQFMSDMRGQLEFYVKLSNYSEKPKISVQVVDIVERTLLMDEEGNAYRPVRWKGPKVKDLVGDDAYTVWFSTTDSDGEDILRRARGRMWLVINDLPREAKAIQVEFKKSLLMGRGPKARPRSLTEKVKDLFR